MHDRLAPASTTKILTAILAIEYGNVDEVVTVAPEDLVGESSMGLVEGEQQSLRNLLYGLMLPSGNDASMTIARMLGASSTSADPTLQAPLDRFISLMNARVHQLGLENSHFVNPSGLDASDHYSSAYDLASITWYALHLPLFNEIVSQVAYETPGHSLLNTNELLTRYVGADGIKTGLTDNAGLCLVGSATRGGTRLISVVLNSPRWYADTTAILDYGFWKLSAMPDPGGDEYLSVGTRDTVAGLISGPPRATAGAANSALQQGGGTSGTESSAAAPSPPQSDVVFSPDFSPVSFAPPDRPEENPILLLGVFFSVGIILCSYVARKLFRFSIASAAGRLMTSSLALFAANDNREVGTESSVLRRRRSPNLLENSDSGKATYIARALVLAHEGREGSAMSEFLLALRYGSISVSELTTNHRLPPTAFLALARAQTALGYYSDARATLVHGVTVLPNNRILSLALHQLTTQ
jgi:hypothetical protein